MVPEGDSTGGKGGSAGGGEGAGGSRRGRGKGGGGGQRRGGGSGGGGGPRGRGNAPRGRGPGGGGDSGGGGGGASGPHPAPTEAAARSTRNALRRHSESLRNDQSKLACRSVLMAVIAATSGSSSPGEVLAMIEQAGHVLEGGRRDEAQLPVTLRAVVAFAVEEPRRSKDVAEMLRLVLRHGYSVAADHLPRLLRDDGGFRASAVLGILEEVAREYLDDAAFKRFA